MPENMFKEMSGLLKSHFENTMNSVNMFQDQTEKITKLMLEQGQNLQNEGKKFMEQWTDSVKKQQEDYKKMLQGQLHKLDDFLNQK